MRTPSAPFEALSIRGESITIDTTGKVLVLPTGQSDILPSFNEYVLNSNRLTLAESPFGGLKGSGSPDYTVGTTSITGTSCVIQDLTGTDKGTVYSAGELKNGNYLTVDATLKTITLEFQIANSSGSSQTCAITVRCPDYLRTQTLEKWVTDVYQAQSVSFSTAIQSAGTKNSLVFSRTLTANSSERLRLVIYYDDVNGTKIYDLSGNNKNGSLYNYSYIKQADGIKFTATGCGINAGALSTNDITLSISFTPTASSNADTRLFYSPDYPALKIYTNTNATLLYKTTAGTSKNHMHTSPIVPGQKNALSITFSNTEIIYILNGVSNTISEPTGIRRTFTTNLSIGSSNTGTLSFIGTIHEAKVTSSTSTLLYYIPKAKNAGETTYLIQETDLEKLSTPWISLYDPSNNYMDFFLFTYIPKRLDFKRDDSGIIYQLVLYPGNGSIYYGQIIHSNLSLDSDSNKIPDCLEPSVEGSVSKFLQSYEMVTGASIDLYTVPLSDSKILPTSDISALTKTNTVSSRASPGEIKSINCIIKSVCDLRDVYLELSNLSDGSNTISKSNIDVKNIKCWYQGGYANNSYVTTGRFLTPELLLKDDTLINVDGEEWSQYNVSNPDGKNYLRVNGSYIDISDDSTTYNDYVIIPISERDIRDTDYFKPVYLNCNINKQLLISIKVPDDATVGTYTGVFKIRSKGETVNTFSLSIEVLQITLLSPAIEYSLYYRGKITPTGSISSESKTEEQFTAEMIDIYQHGVSNPTIYMQSSTLARALEIRQIAGLNNSNLYYIISSPGYVTDTNLLDDLSTNSNTGIMYDVEYVADQSGNANRALSFDGISSYIDLGNPTSLNTQNNITIAVTLKPASVSGSRAILFDTYGNGNIPIELKIEDGNLVFSYIAHDEYFVRAEGGAVSADNVYKIVATFDSSLGTAANKLYLNGSLVGSGNDTTPIPSRTGSLRIGKYNSSIIYSGVIYSIEIYNRTWSQAEVTAYNAGQAVSATGLVGKWKPPSQITSIENLTNATSAYGVSSIYLYGLDEQNLNTVSGRHMIDSVHSAGGKVFVAQSVEQATSIADVLDIAVVSDTPNKTLAETYHSNGHKIFSYANPQSVPESPRTFRMNYGLLLWQNDYDGVMDYAYQHSYGDAWNDFDYDGDYKWRDHCFTYPTASGVIDTIQWEGFRDGVNDMRYLATLQAAIVDHPGTAATTADNWLTTLKSQDLTSADLDAIRGQMIDYILAIQGL